MGENEDIPENVKDIIGKKSVVDVSGSSDQDFNTGDELSCVIGASIVGDDFLRLQKVTYPVCLTCCMLSLHCD